MEYKKLRYSLLLANIVLFILIGFSMCSVGCSSKPVVIVDTGDIERLRFEYQQLRAEYNQLQANYSRLITESKFYADYYSNATAAIASGITELDRLGSSMADDIAKLRGYNNILRNIVNNIIIGQSTERQSNIEIDADSNDTDNA